MSMKRFLVFLLAFIVLLIGTETYLNLRIFPHDLIGTYYEVPIGDNYKLVALSTEYCSIVGNDGIVELDSIDSIHVNNGSIIGKRWAYGGNNSPYFCFATNTGQISRYETMEQLQQERNIQSVTFITMIKYCWNKRRMADILATVTCFFVSLMLTLFLFKKKMNRK